MVSFNGLAEETHFYEHKLRFPLALAGRSYSYWLYFQQLVVLMSHLKRMKGTNINGEVVKKKQEGTKTLETNSSEKIKIKKCSEFHPFAAFLRQTHKTLNISPIFVNWFFPSNLETICKSYVPSFMLHHCCIRLYISMLLCLTTYFWYCIIHSFFHSLFPYTHSHCSLTRCITDLETQFICSLAQSIFFSFPAFCYNFFLETLIL